MTTYLRFPFDTWTPAQALTAALLCGTVYRDVDGVLRATGTSYPVAWYESARNWGVDWAAAAREFKFGFVV